MVRAHGSCPMRILRSMPAEQVSVRVRCATPRTRTGAAWADEVNTLTRVKNDEEVFDVGLADHDADGKRVRAKFGDALRRDRPGCRLCEQRDEGSKRTGDSR